MGTKVEKKNLFLWHVDFKQPMEHKRRSIKKWTEENGVTLLRRNLKNSSYLNIKEESNNDKC